MQGEYRLWRQGGGRGAFAHVQVEVVPWDGGGLQVVTAVDPTDPSTAFPEQAPEWFAAAVQGCQEGLGALCAEEVETTGAQVRVIRLIYTLMDTTPDAIRAAAFLAAAAAFNVQDRFSLVFHEGWRVVPGKSPLPPPASS